ncbi:hypothetical protein GCM10010218_44890 [Streptomyces mashuensis]|uniref:Uncharacterized protein n=1 Tax=Streptomyces mashuensis TaxID=33904 RepID=A0A919EDR8_9ACTN|nr:hypothetical protein GCM10010218_44890 [Streptomyces mashuensis]
MQNTPVDRARRAPRAPGGPFRCMPGLPSRCGAQRGRGSSSKVVAGGGGEGGARPGTGPQERGVARGNRGRDREGPPVNGFVLPPGGRGSRTGGRIGSASTVADGPGAANPFPDVRNRLP